MRPDAVIEAVAEFALDSSEQRTHARSRRELASGNEANVRGTWPTIATTMDRRRATLTRGIGRTPQIDETSRAVR